MEKTFESLRNEIDEIDTELVKLLELRLQIAKELGTLKVKTTFQKPTRIVK